MNMTPQSLRSPVSTYEQQSKQPSFPAPRSSYPTTPQSEPMRQTQGRGLGLIDCGVPHEMPPSPQPSGSWSNSSMMEPDYATSSAPPPDIFSAAFDPFSGFSTNPSTGMMSDQSPEAPGLVYCQSPANSNLPSHRSSVSSTYSPSGSFSPNGSEYLFTTKVKVEESPSEWYSSPAMEHAIVPSGLSPYPQALSPVPTEDVYRTHHSDWSKSDAPGYPISLHDTDGLRIQGSSILPSVTRTKKKRQRTTPEEATHECQVCGKLFKRSYNWKSHLETHNPERKYPHPCTAMIGNTPCTKKFQRKTDLDRHNDSVHLKAKNHQCQLCGNRFARRDTLRRHTEDGCPKRFEVGFREGSAASARWSLNNNFSPRPASSFPMYHRPEFVSNAAHMPSAYHHS